MLVKECKQQMLGIQLLVAVLDGDGLSGPDGFLEFFGESVEVHWVILPSITILVYRYQLI